MHVLLVTPFPVSATGGITTIVRMLAREFMARGCAVSVFQAGEPDEITLVGYIESAPVYTAYLRSPIVPGAVAAGLTAFVVKGPVTLWRLHRFINRHGIDVVLIQYPLAGLSYFAALRSVSRWKLLVTFQGNDAHDLDKRSWIERLLIRALIVRADHVVAVSETLLVKVRRAFNGLPSRAAIIPNGASIPSQALQNASLPSMPTRYIISVGQLIDRKGHDVLVRALGLLAQRGLSLDAVLVGDGPARAALGDLANREGVGEHLHFTGDQPNEFVFPLVAGSWCFVLASRAEGFPLAIVEAMAAGRPVIATNIDGNPQIVRDGVTGMLVPPDDPEALARAIEQLNGDQHRREQMAARGCELVTREYTWRRIAERYRSLFEVGFEAEPSIEHVA